MTTNIENNSAHAVNDDGNANDERWYVLRRSLSPGEQMLFGFGTRANAERYIELRNAKLRYPNQFLGVRLPTQDEIEEHNLDFHDADSPPAYETAFDLELEVWTLEDIAKDEAAHPSSFDA